MKNLNLNDIKKLKKFFNLFNHVWNKEYFNAEWLYSNIHDDYWPFIRERMRFDLEYSNDPELFNYIDSFNKDQLWECYNQYSICGYYVFLLHAEKYHRKGSVICDISEAIAAKFITASGEIRKNRLVTVFAWRFIDINDAIKFHNTLSREIEGCENADVNDFIKDIDVDDDD